MDSLLVSCMVVQLVVVIAPSPLLFWRLAKIGGRVASTMAMFLAAFDGLALIVVLRMWSGYMLSAGCAIRPTSVWGMWIFAMLLIADAAIVRVFWE